MPEVLEQTPVEVEWVGDDEKADADFDPTLTRGQHAVYDIAAIGRDAGWHRAPSASRWRVTSPGPARIPKRSRALEGEIDPSLSHVVEDQGRNSGFAVKS